MINLINPMLSASFYGRMARKQYIAGQFTSHFPFLEGVAGLGPFCLYMMAYLLCASQRLSAVRCRLWSEIAYPFCLCASEGQHELPFLWPRYAWHYLVSPTPPYFLHRVKARGWALCRCQEVLRNLTSGDGWVKTL